MSEIPDDIREKARDAADQIGAVLNKRRYDGELVAALMLADLILSERKATEKRGHGSLEELPDETLLQMHDTIHKIMERRAIDMKVRHRALRDAAAAIRSLGG